MIPRENIQETCHLPTTRKTVLFRFTWNISYMVPLDRSYQQVFFNALNGFVPCCLANFDSTNVSKSLVISEGIPRGCPVWWSRSYQEDQHEISSTTMGPETIHPSNLSLHPSDHEGCTEACRESGLKHPTKAFMEDLRSCRFIESKHPSVYL